MVGDYYQGSRNDTTTAVYYLNNFDNLLRSYGESMAMFSCILRCPLLEKKRVVGREGDRGGEGERKEGGKEGGRGEGRGGGGRGRLNIVEA